MNEHRKPLDVTGSWSLVSTSDGHQYIERKEQGDVVRIWPHPVGFQLQIDFLHADMATSLTLGWDELMHLEDAVRWLRAWHVTLQPREEEES